MPIAPTQQVIEIITKFVDKVTTPMKKVNQVTGEMANQQRILTGYSKRFNVSTRALRKGMADQGLVFQKSGGIYDSVNQRMISTDKAMARAKKSATGFKFAWLGVMFAGMALTRVFGGLIKSQLELFGISELFSAMWTVILLPVMELLLPIILKLTEYLMNLPESVRLTIGVFILLAAGLGIVMLVVGQVMLAISSLILIFGSLSSSLILIPLLFAGLAIGIPLIKKLIDWFRNLESSSSAANEKLTAMGIPPGTIDKIIDFLKLIGDKISEVTPVIKEKFMVFLNSLWEGIKERIPAIMEGIIEIFRSALMWVVDNLPEIIKKGGEFLMAIIKGIIDNTDKISEAITRFIDAFAIFLEDNISAIINFGLKILDTLLEGIIKNIDKIGKAMEEVLIALGKWIGENAWKLIKLGVTIAGHIIAGITKGILGALDSVFERIPGYSRIKGAVNERVFPSFQHGGVIPSTGLYTLHQGETVIPSGRNLGEINVNTVYNINVSDKAEMEKLLRDNNLKLVEEVRRQISV